MYICLIFNYWILNNKIMTNNVLVLCSKTCIALFRWTRQQTVSIMKEYKLKCKSYWLRHQPNLG